MELGLTSSTQINCLVYFRGYIVLKILKALEDVRLFDPLLPFILYTGSLNEVTAIECIKAGANDYIIKEHMTRLPFAVKEAHEQHRIQIEKRAAEQLLKVSEEKFRSIMENSADAIFLTDQQGKCQYTNTQ